MLPREVYDRLSEHVIGQGQVKKVLAVGVHNHFKRLRASLDIEDESLAAAGEREGAHEEGEGSRRVRGGSTTARGARKGDAESAVRVGRGQGRQLV